MLGSWTAARVVAASPRRRRGCAPPPRRTTAPEAAGDAREARGDTAERATAAGARRLLSRAPLRCATGVREGAYDGMAKRVGRRVRWWMCTLSRHSMSFYPRQSGAVP